MGKRDPRIDAYITKAGDFAKPILKHLRELVHSACPDVEETMKWSHPHFVRKGILCNMAAFKQHCAFRFWKNSLVVGKAQGEEGAVSRFRRITALSDLPSDRILIGYIKKAVQLDEEGIKPSPRSRPTEKKELIMPDDFRETLAKNKKAQATFENFSYSHKKEYLDWISEARKAETRQRRIETALRQMGEGKSRDWKYQNC
jgi:uncharacterized protein YdeI (YjbR/CyaY-like superfamily)